MINAQTLPSPYLAVLEAMTRPGPQPPDGLDSPALAVHRRLPDFPTSRIINILRDLNALGLTEVPYIEGMLSPEGTADPARWITEEGWRVLGLPSQPDGSREN